tara:strand:- start:63 stop:467 length:405 start_codon:yes stop_codon:yes gene_type:complete
MKTILVEISYGELLDKISILEIKKERINDSEKLKFINDDLNLLKIQMHKVIESKNFEGDEKLKKLFLSLKEINAKLWVVEDDKRICEKNSDFGEKFIKLSRNVHFFNDERSKIKLEINNLTDSKIKEVKQYTSY